MISVMNDCDIDRKSGVAADLPLLNVETTEKSRVSEGFRVSSELDYVEPLNNIESRVSGGVLHWNGTNDDFSVVNVESESRLMGIEYETKYSHKMESKRKSRVSGVVNGVNDEETRVSEGEEETRVSEGEEETRVSLLDNMSEISNHGFEPGDMVWGKVKSHPWWPGHIFNEAFASSTVRRTRRENHVLVAFFGDSSYGWFNLSELIPFEPHYAEKSKQTNSRAFVKAVDEAVDEASRRSALGLACRCRNPFNFRPTNVSGYYAVDVDDYEPGAVYSVKEIQKARDLFQSVEMLSFVKGLAMVPQKREPRTIDWIKNMATVIAYRKAVFEEFDETYAQAFGIQPVRPARNSLEALDQLEKSRAPLSGPLVIAEALGERKNSTKPVKAKDLSKKDRYMFKRREELNDQRILSKSDSHILNQGQANYGSPSAFKKETGDFPARVNDYVFQKRLPAVVETIPLQEKQETKVSDREGTAQETKPIDRKIVVTKSNLAEEKENARRLDMPAGISVGSASRPLAYDGVGPSEGKLEPESVDMEVEVKQEMPVKMKFNEDVVSATTKMEGSNLSVTSESSLIDQKDQETDQVMEGIGGKVFSESVSTAPSSIDVQLPGKAVGVLVGVDGVVTKAKVLKRPSADLSSNKSVMGEKKKKKKKDSGLDTGSDRLHKRRKIMKDGESVKKSAGKSIGIGLVNRETKQMDSQRKDDGVDNISNASISATLTPRLDMVDVELSLPQLVNDLLGLALDPFHGIENNSPANVRQVFLRFRSLVYQKSLVLPPVIEPETSEPRGSKSSEGKSLAESGYRNDEISSTGDARHLPSGSKSLKHLSRSDDPSRVGRKRGISDRQEDKAAKRLKKVNELKSMASEKKAGGLKKPEVKQDERKDATITVASVKPVKMDSIKKPEVRTAEPATLVMKFPPRTSLPSVPQLKARFARFGPLDLNGMRIYWKSHTCKVVFKHKSDAHTAYNHALRNNALFGQVRVSYHLREHDTPAHPELSEASKRRAEEGNFSGGGVEFSGELRTPFRQRTPTVQLKSCLKKPVGDEAGSIAGAPREIPRVKFLLDGEESSKGEQLVGVSSNSNNTSSIGDGGSSLPLDFNSKNLKPFIPPPAFVPLPRFSDVHENRGIMGQFNKAATHAHFSQVVEARNNNDNKVDISHQMLSLMMRCNDIVRDVKSSLGYVPYHPL